MLMVSKTIAVHECTCCVHRVHARPAQHIQSYISLERLAAEDAAGEHAIEIEAGVLKLDM